MMRFLPLLALFLIPARFGWSETFEHRTYNFSFEAPPEFEVIRDPQPNIGVLLKHKVGGFPTFNVLIQGGGFFPSHESVDRVGKDTVREYALVGFTDAKLEGSSLTEVNGTPAQEVEIVYSYLGKALKATVWKLKGDSEHLILTYIEEASDKNSSIARSQIIESFVITGGLAPTSAPSGKVSNSFLKIAAIAGIILAAGTIWYLTAGRSSFSA